MINKVDDFEDSFKLYFVNAFLIAHNSPLLFANDNEIINLMNILFIVDKSELFEHLDDLIDD